MHLLWNGLASTCWSGDIEILFGVASFHGTDPEPLAEALTLCTTSIWRRPTCGCGRGPSTF